MQEAHAGDRQRAGRAAPDMVSAIPSARVEWPLQASQTCPGPQADRQAGGRRRAADGPWGLSLSPVALLFMVKFTEEAGLGAGVEVLKKVKRQL